jgi:hypothetical protein
MLYCRGFLGIWLFLNCYVGIFDIIQQKSKERDILDSIFKEMTPSDYLNIIAIIVTVVSMILTIRYANKAKKYKEQIQFDIRKINLTNIVEKLKRSQEEIRDLPKSKPIERGIKIKVIIKTLQKHFDFTLNLLDNDGLDSDIRIHIHNAQLSLNEYEKTFSEDKINESEANNIKEFVQIAIAKSNTKILDLEKDM